MEPKIRRLGIIFEARSVKLSELSLSESIEWLIMRWNLFCVSEMNLTVEVLTLKCRVMYWSPGSGWGGSRSSVLGELVTLSVCHTSHYQEKESAIKQRTHKYAICTHTTSDITQSVSKVSFLKSSRRLRPWYEPRHVECGPLFQSKRFLIKT